MQDKNIFFCFLHKKYIFLMTIINVSKFVGTITYLCLNQCINHILSEKNE